jgi:hypothetical protein
MYVVRHEAVGVQGAACFGKQASEVEQIKAAVLILEETRCSVIPPLHNVHGETTYHYAGTTRHACSTTQRCGR